MIRFAPIIAMINFSQTTIDTRRASDYLSIVKE